jgi:hypothetical protein
MPTDEREIHARASQTTRKAAVLNRKAAVLNGLRSTKPVHGLTHRYYRYPARFPPEFVREVIQHFTRPGDTVLDPFMGGGTTAVEALAMGRKVVGVDLNPIAVFTTRVKSTPLTTTELKEVRRLVARIAQGDLALNRYTAIRTEDPLLINVPWWLRRALLRLLQPVERVTDPHVRAFLKCGLLKTAQWALDSREMLPTSQAFIEGFCGNVAEMCDDMEGYRETLHSSGVTSRRQLSMSRRLLLADAAKLPRYKPLLQGWRRPTLVLTSPPYPGVHVLYNRWQVQGRRETRAPFWILDQPDGHYASFFTFGSRERIDDYFSKLKSAFEGIGAMLSPRALVVQLVSFANPDRDVRRYLRIMQSAGFDECDRRELGLGTGYRFRRVVPNRKWYMRYQDAPPMTKEVLLVHRLAKTKH